MIETEPELKKRTAAWMLARDWFYPHEVEFMAVGMIPEFLVKGWLEFKRGELGYMYHATEAGRAANLGLEA
jgi:hypothetical protein